MDGPQTCEPVRMTAALKVITLSDCNCDRLESVSLGVPLAVWPLHVSDGRDFIKDGEEEDSSSL